MEGAISQISYLNFLVGLKLLFFFTDFVGLRESVLSVAEGLAAALEEVFLPSVVAFE